KAFRPRILADRERIEAGRRLPEDLVRELAHAGFFRISLPAAYGGLDLTPMAAAEVFEEFARADASVAWCVWNGNTYWTTVRWAKEVARAVFTDPDTILANSTRPSGRAGAGVDGRWSSRVVTGSAGAGRWSAAASSAPGSSSCASSMRTVSHDSRPQVRRNSGSCFAPPPTATSWIPGRSPVCEAPGATMS